MGIMDLLSSILPQDFGDQPTVLPPDTMGGPLPQTRDVPLPRPKPYEIAGGAPQGTEVPLDQQMAGAIGGGMPFYTGGGGNRPALPPGAQIPETTPPPPMSGPSDIAGMGGQTPQPAPGIPLPPPPSAPQGGVPPLPPGGVPLTPPRPPGAVLPPGATPTAGAGTPGAPPGPPLSLAPPPQTAMPVKTPPPLPPQGPYAIPETRPVNKGQQFMSGVGAGLSKIQGSGKFASFARGAGQGIEGAEKSNQDQTKDNRAAQGQHFNQLSTSFRDMMLAQQQNNMQAYREAQAKYLSARADALKAGGTGSNAWQNTPYGRVMNIEKQVATEKDRALKVLQQQWKQNGTAPEQQKADQDAIEQKMQQRSQELYQRAGVDPNQAEKLKTMGMSQQNPFDARTMPADQFHSQVPIGAWYLNKDGKLYQRTAPPPGTATPKPQAKSDTEPNMDDYAAMSSGGQEDQIPASETG